MSGKFSAFGRWSHRLGRHSGKYLVADWKICVYASLHPEKNQDTLHLRVKVKNLEGGVEGLSGRSQE